jgi:hypothetical protein
MSSTQEQLFSLVRGVMDKMGDSLVKDMVERMSDILVRLSENDLRINVDRESVDMFELKATYSNGLLAS